MNQELAVREGAVLAPRPAMPLIDDAFMQTVQMIVGSGLYGTTREAQGRAVVKILWGREMGFEPMTSLEGIHVIDTGQGGPKCQLSGRLIAAKIKASSSYDYLDYFSGDESCTVTVFRGKVRSNDPATIDAQIKDGSLGIIGVTSFTVAEARKAGLIRQGGNWEKYVRDMLWNRCMSRARRYVGDLFIGLSATVVDADDADRLPMAHDQRKALFAGLKEHGIDDDHRHRWASDVLGREVVSFSSDCERPLTRREAQHLLDWLNDLPQIQAPGVMAPEPQEVTAEPDGEAGEVVSTVAGDEAVADAAPPAASVQELTAPAQPTDRGGSPSAPAPAGGTNPEWSASRNQFERAFKEAVTCSAIKTRRCVEQVLAERPTSQATDDELDAITALLATDVIHGGRPR